MAQGAWMNPQDDNERIDESHLATTSRVLRQWELFVSTQPWWFVRFSREMPVREVSP